MNKTRMYGWANWNSWVRRILGTLKNPHQHPYKVVRKHIISQHGYDVFREMQRDAFSDLLK